MTSPKLSEAQRRMLEIGKLIGPRPGSNMWPLVEVQFDDFTADGAEIDALVRLGFLAGRPRGRPIILVHEADDIADCDVDCDFDYDITPAGRQALKETRG